MEVAYLCIFVAALSFGLGLQLVTIAICSDAFQQKYWAVLGFSCAVIGLLNFMAMFYGYFISRLATRPPIGRFGRFAVDATSVCIALFLGEFVKDGYNLRSHSLGHNYPVPSFLSKGFAYCSRHGFGGYVGGVVFAGTMVYETSQRSKDIYSTVAVLVFCGIVIVFRCWLYSPPTKPVNVSKKVDDDIAC